MLFVVQSGMAALVIALLASSGEEPANPLGGSSPPAAEGAAVDALTGAFKGEKFTILIRRESLAKYAGTIRMGEKELPVTASGDGKRLRGKFTSNGATFEFTAALEGDTLTLSTGGTNHTLQRAAAPRSANPLAGQPPAGKPDAAPPAAKPDAPPPAGPAGKFEVIRETPTGKALFEARAATRSAKQLLAEVVKDLTAYLGQPPAVAGAFADAKDIQGGASFTARFKDRPIKGMILVGIGEKGGAATVVFDSADAPAKSLSALAAAVPVETKWEDARLPDGSGSMRLPAGWRITGAANGAADVMGPEGQNVELGLAFPVNTPEYEQQYLDQQTSIGIQPRPSGLVVAPFPPDAVKAVEIMVPVFSRMLEANGGPPVTLERIVESAPSQYPGGNSGFVHAITRQGRGDQAVRIHSLGLVTSVPIGNGQWMYYTSYVSAPEEAFTRDLPVMLEIWASWKVSDQVLKGRLKKAMDDLKTAGEMWRQSTEYASRVQSKTNADFCEVIRGYRTVEDTLTGTRGEADLGNVDRIVEKMNEGEGYQRYKQIPLRDQ